MVASLTSILHRYRLKYLRLITSSMGWAAFPTPSLPSSMLPTRFLAAPSGAPSLTFQKTSLAYTTILISPTCSQLHALPALSPSFCTH
ncbi:hypothetical protein M758_1G327400 [Ceratodon purpureus]|nr:hypothetical protein M758_1G327400 [Ceratodon purpureus]